jgi:hypothetical protein
MLNFDTIKSYYNKGLWSEQLVLMAVKKGILTADEANEIINENGE